MSVGPIGRGDPPTSASATPPLTDDAPLFESYLNGGSNAERQPGAVPNAVHYAFNDSPWSPGTPVMTDSPRSSGTPTMTESGPLAGGLSWIAFGFALAEALDRAVGPPPVKQGDYALAPHLSLRVFGQGRTGPNGETAVFLQRNAQLGQGEDQVLPVRAEWTSSSGLKFDQNELEQAHGGKLPADVRRRLGLQGSGPDDSPKKPDSEKPGFQVAHTVVQPPGGAQADDDTGGQQTWRVDTAGRPEAAGPLAAQAPSGFRTILIDTPARIQATEPVLNQKQTYWTWQLFDAQSGAVFGRVSAPIKDPLSLYLFPRAAVRPNEGGVELRANFSFTVESLKVVQSTWERIFGRPLEDLGASLTEANLRNFQVEYDEIRLANPGLSRQQIGDLAIERVSFGKGRKAIGFGELRVYMSKFGDVTIENGPYQGRHLTDVPGRIYVRARRTPSSGDKP
jgi:hypothetical protein